MKRALLVAAAVVLLLVVAVVAPFAVAFVGNKPLDAAALGERVQPVLDGYVASFVLDVGGGKVAFIDAGQSDAPLRAHLAAQQKQPDDVVAIFLTHGHPDHMGGVGGFEKAVVYALAAEAPMIKGDATWDSPIAFVTGLLGRDQPKSRVDVRLKDGDVVKVGDVDVEVLAVPGHTAGSAAYFAHGVLFLGDAASATDEGRVKNAPWVFSDDVDQAARSIQAVARRLQPRAADVKHLAPSHTGALAGLQPLLDFAP